MFAASSTGIEKLSPLPPLKGQLIKIFDTFFRGGGTLTTTDVDRE